MKLVLISLFLGFSLAIFGQSALNDSGVKYVPEENIASVTLLGTGSYLGMSYERMFHNRLSLEVGLGIVGYGIGLNIYPLQKTLYKELNWFTGFRYTRHGMVDSGSREVSYIPFGATWFGPSGITLSLDLGPGLHTFHSGGREIEVDGQPESGPRREYPYSEINIWGSLKVGMRF